MVFVGKNGRTEEQWVRVGFGSVFVCLFLLERVHDGVDRQVLCIFVAINVIFVCVADVKETHGDRGDDG